MNCAKDLSDQCRQHKHHNVSGGKTKHAHSKGHAQDVLLWHPLDGVPGNALSIILETALNVPVFVLHTEITQNVNCDMHKM